MEPKDNNLAWELFKNTGSIDAYMMIRELEACDAAEMPVQSPIEQNPLGGIANPMGNVMGEQNGYDQNQGNSYQGF